jgi:hypothetical protein
MYPQDRKLPKMMIIMVSGGSNANRPLLLKVSQQLSDERRIP